MSQTVTLRLTIADPVPGVLYSLQDRDSRPVDPVRAGDGAIALDACVTLQPDGRLTGAHVRREGAERRFVHIGIGKHAGDADSYWDRRAKVDIHDIPPEILVPDAVLEIVLPGRGKDGSPACATVRPINDWRRVSAAG